MISSNIKACRSSLTRFAVISIKNPLVKTVAILYMKRYSDLQVRQELKITVKKLKEIKLEIKQYFYNVGITEDVI